MITLNITIDLRSDVPAYVQIIENIQRLAANGSLEARGSAPHRAAAGRGPAGELQYGRQGIPHAG